MKRDNGGEVDTDDDTWVLYPFFDNSDRTRLKRTCNDIARETNRGIGKAFLGMEWPLQIMEAETC